MRRFLVVQAEHRAMRLLQIQIILAFGLLFGFVIAPPWIVIIAYGVMQASEVHAMIVFRALLRAARDPRNPLTYYKRRVVEYELGSAAAVSVALLMGYCITEPVWTMGVLAIWTVGAIYFIHGAKHDKASLYGTLGLISVAMVIAVLARAYIYDEMGVMQMTPYLALVAFLTFTLFSIGANARRDHFVRLEYEESLEAAVSAMHVESAAKSNLLAQLSHEIRTPLNGMLGAAELLSLKGLSKDQGDLLNVMRDSGRHLVGVLDRTLEMSAAEVGAIAVSLRTASLDKLVGEEVALFQAEAAKAGAKLTMASGVCKAVRQLDDVRVRQCLANLIANAIRHSGGDEITVGCTVSGEDQVTIRVVDNGRGVPEGSRDAIFRAFGAKGLEGPYARQGAGLGLAISRAIARAMGGDLDLAQTGPNGSVFELSFRAAPA